MRYRCFLTIIADYFQKIKLMTIHFAEKKNIYRRLEKINWWLGKKNNTDYWKKSCEYSFSQVEILFFCCCWIHVKFSQVETWKSDVFTLLNFIFSSQFFFSMTRIQKQNNTISTCANCIYIFCLFVHSFFFFDNRYYFFSIWSILFFSIVDIF